jgi:hypothetical protein
VFKPARAAVVKLGPLFVKLGKRAQAQRKNG